MMGGIDPHANLLPWEEETTSCRHRSPRVCARRTQLVGKAVATMLTFNLQMQTLYQRINPPGSESWLKAGTKKYLFLAHVHPPLGSQRWMRFLEKYAITYP